MAGGRDGSVGTPGMSCECLSCIIGSLAGIKPSSPHPLNPFLQVPFPFAQTFLSPHPNTGCWGPQQGLILVLLTTENGPSSEVRGHFPSFLLSIMPRAENSFQEGPFFQIGNEQGRQKVLSVAGSSHLLLSAALFRIIPLYLIYRPANNIPYATLEEDLGKPLQSYCSRGYPGCAGAPAAPSGSEAMQKCQTFQHWLYQWTNGSFLVTDLAGRRVEGAQAHHVGACGDPGRAQSTRVGSQCIYPPLW